ncbi:MAG: CaiB/BaiF CoA transferase family protein [Magnetovibrionaceae bacterium]
MTDNAPKNAHPPAGPLPGPLSGPLAGLVVLDLTRILAGPTCTQLLGDLGADVIKVERPGAGDDTRKWGPPYAKDAEGRDTRESAYYLAANRSKRSITIDMASEEGQELIGNLAAKADILVENFKTGGLKAYGLDYDSLHARFPGLIYCSITGFGQTGPYAKRAGYDFLAQGLGGIMSLTGEPEGEPMKVGVGVSDVMCGMYAAVAILAALRHRDATGLGQQIDLSLLDTQVAWLVNEGTNYLMSGEVPKRRGNAHPNIVPYQLFASSDGHVILAVGNDGQFARFCEAAGIAALSSDERFATNPARIENREALIPLIAEAMVKETTDHWVATLEALGVPCGPVNRMDRVFEDPQVKAREMILHMDHAEAVDGVDLIANPIKFSETPVTCTKAPPFLGQHTEEVLGEVLGLSEAEIAGLKARGIV